MKIDVFKMKKIVPRAILTLFLFIFLLVTFSCKKGVMGDAKIHFLSGERYYNR